MGEYHHERVMPIPLRPDVTVFFQDIPSDLTPKEAAKLTKVVLALGGVYELPKDTPND